MSQFNSPTPSASGAAAARLAELSPPALKPTNLAAEHQAQLQSNLTPAPQTATSTPLAIDSASSSVAVSPHLTAEQIEAATSEELQQLATVSRIIVRLPSFRSASCVTWVDC